MNSLISYVLSLSLILGPYAPALAQTDPASKCAPGEIYNTFSKKCMGSEESRELNAEADQECNVLTDPQLRARCAASRVEEKTSRAEQNGDMGSHADNISKIKLLPVLLAFATLYAGILHMVKKPADCKGSMSSYAMIGGAVTILATEAMTKLSFSKELKKSQQELNDIVNGSKSAESDNKNATDLQAAIFDALIKRENGVIEAAEGKKKGYNLAKLMFITATVLAGIETAKYLTMKATPPTAAAGEALYVCFLSSTAKLDSINKSSESYVFEYLNYLNKANSKISFIDYSSQKLPDFNLSESSFQAQSMDMQRLQNGHYSSLSTEDFEEIKLYNKFDHSLSILLSTLRNFIISDVNAAALHPFLVPAKSMQKLFLSPFTRLGLAGTMTAVTFTLTGHADKEIKKARKRIEVLEKLKAQVTEAGPAVKCANGTEQGKEGCKQVVPTTIKPGDSTFGLARTQANGAANTNRSGAFAAKGCAAKNGQADPECGCKKSNSCFSMNSNFNIGNTPAGNILGTGVSDLNALTSGELSPSNLNSEAMGKQLAAAGKMRDKMLSDLNKDPKLAAEIKKAQEAMNGLQRQIFNTMPANGGGAGNSLALSSDSDMSGMSGNQVLEQVKEELKEASAPKVTNEAVAGSGESDFNFDIGTADPMNVGTGLTEGEGTANTNIDDFELAESEINPSSTTNIFEILSSRYKKSAYMRLLKADKEIAPEAPAEKEIND